MATRRPTIVEPARSRIETDQRLWQHFGQSCERCKGAIRRNNRNAANGNCYAVELKRFGCAIFIASRVNPRKRAFRNVS
jgi:hypothetical protein